MDVLLATSRDLPELDQDDAPLVAALRDAGIEAEMAVWDDPDVDWASARLVLVRSTWDYTDRRDEFVEWAKRVDAVTDLQNPAEVIRWNTHKGYLLELEERGAPIVPTAWLGQGDRIDLADLLTSRAWKRAVIKPAIDAGSRGLRRVDATDGADLAAGQAHLDHLLANGDVMVQPYLESIETDGELSVVFFDGEFSHAVRKRPAPDDFRIQVEYGGRYSVEEIDGDVRDLAAWILESTGQEFLYARVDLVADETGAPQLAELELTEPSLYLTHVPGAAEKLAAAVAKRLG